MSDIPSHAWLARSVGGYASLPGGVVIVGVVTLAEICANVRQLSSKHEWDQTDPAARMLYVTAEVGEVAEALVSLQAASSDQVDAARHALGHEIFDVIWNLCALANATGIDLERAARTKMAANEDRTWPDRFAM